MARRQFRINSQGISERFTIRGFRSRMPDELNEGGDFIKMGVNAPLQLNTQVSSKLVIEVVSEWSDFLKLETEWQDLINRTQVHNISLDFHWLRIWLAHFQPKQLFVLLVRDKSGLLVGAAPFQINTGQRGLTHRMLRFLQFIGTSPNTYDLQDILVDPSQDLTDIVTQMAFKVAESRDTWDVIDLCFCVNYAAMEIFRDILSEATHEISLHASDKVLYKRLPESVEQYKQERIKSLRRTMTRAMKKVSHDFPEQSPVLTFVPPSEAGNLLLEKFFENHQAYWSKNGCRSDFARFKNLENYYKALFCHFGSIDEPASGRIVFSVLKFGEKVVSYEFASWHGNEYMGHIASYKEPYKTYYPGFIHFDWLFQYAIEKKAPVFHMGRGDGAYKQNWSTTYYDLYSILGFKNSWTARIWTGDQWLKKCLNKA